MTAELVISIDSPTFFFDVRLHERANLYAVQLVEHETSEAVEELFCDVWRKLNGRGSTSLWLQTLIRLVSLPDLPQTPSTDLTTPDVTATLISRIVTFPLV